MSKTIIEQVKENVCRPLWEHSKTDIVEKVSTETARLIFERIEKEFFDYAFPDDIGHKNFVSKMEELKRECGVEK